MTTWEYRVVRQDTVGWGFVTTTYAIHEVYYEEGETEPSSWTRTPVEARGETPEELREDLERMLEAAKKPYLQFDRDFPIKQRE